MTEHDYYNSVDTTRVCPKPNKGIIMSTRKKKTRVVLSVRRFRLRIANFFRVLKRWRRSWWPYGRILHRMTSNPSSGEFGWRSRSSSSSSSSASAPVYAGSGNYKFYSEAIADCLEFIKRNSISVDDNKDLIRLSDVVC